MSDETFHVFVPTGDGTCAICKLSVRAEVHGGYEDVCPSCGHAKPHNQPPIGVCEFADCGCDGVTTSEPPLKTSDILHLCDRCHGEVYTFPSRVISLEQRKIFGVYWASFTFKDEDEDELFVYPHSGSVILSVNNEAVRVPLDVLEAVVEALRVTGLRAVEKGQR